MSAFRVSQHFNDRIELAATGATCADAVYRFDPDQPKACVHPLATPSGIILSGFEMSDHVWHRGLWFAIKYVNGTNFWEEQAPYGIQVSRAQPRVELVDSNAARITHDIDWTSESTGSAIHETRTLLLRRDGDTRLIDWTSRLHAQIPLKLDRTPYTTWGGYGGLAFRSSRELHDVSFVLPDGQVTQSLAGQPHAWCLMHARADGGPERRVSLGMIDHPDNVRGPSPWYCKTGNGFTYMNPAFLFHEPMSLAIGQPLTLRYRVAWCDGIWQPEQFAELARRYQQDGDAQP